MDDRARLTLQDTGQTRTIIRAGFISDSRGPSTLGSLSGGGVSERPKERASKAREGQPSAGSNPAATASLTRPNPGHAATWPLAISPVVSNMVSIGPDWSLSWTTGGRRGGWLGHCGSA